MGSTIYKGGAISLEYNIKGKLNFKETLIALRW